jgi:hypothetical protein
MDLLDAAAYLPYVWTIPTVSSTPPNPRDEIRSLVGDEDDVVMPQTQGYGDGRDQFTGY